MVKSHYSIEEPFNNIFNLNLHSLIKDSLYVNNILYLSGISK